MQIAALKVQLADEKPQSVVFRHLNLQANLARRVARRSATVRPEPMRLGKRAVVEHG
jgi:hypothetical protein